MPEMPKEQPKCQECGKPVESGWHSCPFAEEMQDNYEELCNCCAECEQNCRDSI